MVNGSYVVRLFKDESDVGEKVVVEAGNVSEATTEPVHDDSEFGRELVEELVDDVVSSFVAEEAVCPDSSGSYDSGTFSKDLNSPQGKNGNQELRLAQDLIDVEKLAFETAKLHLVADCGEAAIGDGIADSSLDSGDHDGMTGITCVFGFFVQREGATYLFFFF